MHAGAQSKLMKIRFVNAGGDTETPWVPIELEPPVVTNRIGTFVRYRQQRSTWVESQTARGADILQS